MIFSLKTLKTTLCFEMLGNWILSLLRDHLDPHLTILVFIRSLLIPFCRFQWEELRNLLFLEQG